MYLLSSELFALLREGNFGAEAEWMGDILSCLIYVFPLLHTLLLCHHIALVLNPGSFSLFSSRILFDHGQFLMRFCGQGRLRPWASTLLYVRVRSFHQLKLTQSLRLKFHVRKVQDPGHFTVLFLRFFKSEAKATFHRPRL
jgi:hypothetical protein